MLSIYRLDRSLFLKVFLNLVFLVRLIFTRNKTIVLAIAPFDYRMLFFNFLSTWHSIYYHTSWPFWDGKRIVKKALVKKLEKYIHDAWSSFLEENVKGIFYVTETAKQNMAKSFKITAQTSVVYHSSSDDLFYSPDASKQFVDRRFLFVGRLEPSKGIEFLLKLIEERAIPGFQLGIVGFGSLHAKVVECASKFKNITFYGKVNGKDLGNLYRNHHIVVVPSTRGEKRNFEELFGITIIEAMLCGAVPIATDHVGPTEIIQHGSNGYLVKDNIDLVDNLQDIIEYVLRMSPDDLKEISMNSIATSRRYSPSNVSKLWKSLNS
jgi:glycosyltransferase involved in cell wall biosynthesis